MIRRLKRWIARARGADPYQSEGRKMAIVPLARVVGDNVNRDGKNRGSLAFYIKAENGIEQEVGRVAFERTNGLWKNKSWDEALAEVKTRIKSSIETMHELTEYAGKLL